MQTNIAWCIIIWLICKKMFPQKESTFNDTSIKWHNILKYAIIISLLYHTTKPTTYCLWAFRLVVKTEVLWSLGLRFDSHVGEFISSLCEVYFLLYKGIVWFVSLFLPLIVRFDWLIVMMYLWIILYSPKKPLKKTYNLLLVGVYMKQKYILNIHKFCKWD